MRGWWELGGELVDFLEQRKTIARLIARQLFIRYTFRSDVDDNLTALTAFGDHLDFVTIPRMMIHHQRKPTGGRVDVSVVPEGDYRVIRLDLKQDTISPEGVFGQ